MSVSLGEEGMQSWALLTQRRTRSSFLWYMSKVGFLYKITEGPFVKTHFP